MRLKLDTSGVQFMVAQAPEAKIDPLTKAQRTEKDTGRPQWVVMVCAMWREGEKDRSAQVRVTVVGEKPRVNQGQYVQFVGLEAIPWNQNDRSGVAYRAESVSVAPTAKAA